MHTTNASYGSGFAPLETPLATFGAAVTGATAPGAMVGVLPTMSHDRNYPYRPKLRPQILTTAHADAKRVVFEKEFPSVKACHTTASPFTGEGTRHIVTAVGTRALAAPELDLPPALQADKAVLRFWAYYQESIPESTEAVRIHHTRIHYYLADGTLDVQQSVEENSGLMHGTLVSRHKVPKSSKGTGWATLHAHDLVASVTGESGGGAGDVSAPHEFIDWRDLSVGVEVEIYGKVYHIADADDFTRGWYEERGIAQEPGTPMPLDAVAQRLALAKTTGPKAETGHGKVMFPMKQYHEAKQGKFIRDPEARRRFQEHDKHVLRFDCVWDNSAAELGDVHHVILQYFLADDMAEVRMLHGSNDGYDRVPCLIRKMPLPKAGTPTGTDPAANPELFLRPQDIRIGGTVDVFGRTLQVRTCHPWTRDWYAGESAPGIEAQPEDLPFEPPPPPAKPVVRPPPHNGIGSEEDSLQSCFTFNVRPLKKDFSKWASNDGTVHRFHAKLVSANPMDALRNFTIALYPSDDSVAVFEPPVRNSGFKGGVHLQRSKVRLASGKPLTAADIRVGETVEIHKHVFRVTDADKATTEALGATLGGRAEH